MDVYVLEEHRNSHYGLRSELNNMMHMDTLVFDASKVSISELENKFCVNLGPAECKTVTLPDGQRRVLRIYERSVTKIVIWLQSLTKTVNRSLSRSEHSVASFLMRE